MKVYSRILAFLLALVLVLGSFAGCGDQQQTADTATTEATESIDKGSTPNFPGNTTDRSLYTSGYFDYFQPAEISTRHKLQPLDGFRVGSQKEHTILIYMVGSDLESGRYGCASRDLEEIWNSGLDTSKTNLVVYAGGANSWKVNISSAQNSLLQLNGDQLEFVAVTQEAANMGNPRVLADFLNYGYTNFPAKSYSVIFWNHGGGPICGYGQDEQFKDILEYHELKWAMDNSPFKNKKLEMVGFDACLMASLEIADLFADYAHYMVASEETEPGTGWDYSFLKVYNSKPTTLQVTDKILSTYRASLKNTELITLSCLDLSKVDAANEAASDLFLRIAEGCLTGQYNTLSRLRRDTKRYGTGAFEYDLVDLGHLSQQLQTLYPTEAKAMQNALSKIVVKQVTNQESTNGLTIYFPFNSQTNFLNFGEGYSSAYYDNQGYQLFIKAYASMWIPGRQQLSWDAIKPQDQTPPATEPTEAPTQAPTQAPTEATQAPTEPAQTQENISLGQVDPNETYYTWQIDPAFLSTYCSASYTVLRYNRDRDSYTPVLTNAQAIVDQNGTIYVPADPQLFTITTNSTSDTAVWLATQAEVTSGKTTYYAQSTLLASGDVIIGDSKPVEFLFSQTADGAVTIERILTRNEDATLFGKTDVELSNWSSVGILSCEYYLTRDLEGNVLPATQWETDGSLTVEYVPYTQWIRLGTQKVSQLEGDYYLELSLVDTQGQQVNVAYQTLKTEEFEVATHPVTWGTMTFHVYQDHAELVSYQETFNNYSGDQPAALEIPQMMLRKPVTVIGASAFQGSYSISSVVIPSSVKRIEDSAFRACYNLKQISTTTNLKYIGAQAFYGSPLEAAEISGTVETIGWRAFASTKLTTVTIPKSVKLMGTGAFYGCANLTEINVESGNSAYKSVDGVLFTADGKTLMCYPAGKGSSYVIPTGTEVIGAEAFRWCETLTSVTIPEGVVQIAPLAFCDTLNLTTIGLPNSVVSIGSAAFGKSIGAIPTTTLAISIGTDTAWIGEQAFDGYLVTGFTVAEDNLYYSAEGAYLMNVSGTELVRVANQLQGVATVPETVNHIASGAFDECTGLTEVILPDSVTSMAAYADMPETLEKLTIGAGLLNWNNLKKCATIGQIQLSANNPNFRMKDGCIYDADMGTLLLFTGDATRYTMPDTVTEVASGAFASATSLKEITLSANVHTMPDGVFSACSSLESISCPGSNLFYTAKDGLLYSKDGTKLLSFPMGKTGTVKIADGTLEIARGAIYDSSYLQAEHIIFPEGLIAIREYNLTSKGYGKSLTLELPVSLTDIHPNFLRYIWDSNVLIKCPAGSAAAQFAAQRNFPVEN